VAANPKRSDQTRKTRIKSRGKTKKVKDRKKRRLSSPQLSVVVKSWISSVQEDAGGEPSIHRMENWKRHPTPPLCHTNRLKTRKRPNVRKDPAI